MSQVADLTEQQKNCLRFVHEGLTSKQIAPLLDTTPGVIDNYINAALAKLGQSSRREAARMLAAHENGMVQQLHLQPEPVASSPLPGDQGGQGDEAGAPLASFFTLPPLGGRGNDLTTPRRFAAIANVAFFSALLMLAAVVIVQGIIQLLS